MTEVPDIISYDGRDFILWTSGVWKVERQVKRQGDVLIIFTPDGQPAMTVNIFAADMMVASIENALRGYYFEKGTNGK